MILSLGHTVPLMIIITQSYISMVLLHKQQQQPTPKVQAQLQGCYLPDAIHSHAPPLVPS